MVYARKLYRSNPPLLPTQTIFNRSTKRKESSSPISVKTQRWPRPLMSRTLNTPLISSTRHETNMKTLLATEGNIPWKCAATQLHPAARLLLHRVGQVSFLLTIFFVYFGFFWMNSSAEWKFIQGNYNSRPIHLLPLPPISMLFFESWEPDVESLPTLMWVEKGISCQEVTLELRPIIWSIVL